MHKLHTSTFLSCCHNLGRPSKLYCHTLGGPPKVATINQSLVTSYAHIWSTSCSASSYTSLLIIELELLDCGCLPFANACLREHDNLSGSLQLQRPAGCSKADPVLRAWQARCPCNIKMTMHGLYFLDVHLSNRALLSSANP